jgi:endo-1,4-beta-D-glucanase Y
MTSSGGAGGVSTGSGGASGGAGGVTTGTGGAAGGAAGGVVGTGGNSSCPAVSADVISDFEENSGVMKMQGTPTRTGWWYDYPSPVPSGTMLSPTPMTTAIPVEASGDTSMCNKYALHIKGSGYGAAPNNYVGFGAAFLPMAPPSQLKTAYNVGGYTGISFKIKSGSGTPPAVYFEMLTKESQPSDSGGTATTDTIDKYNTRGQMLVTPYIASALSTTWQTVTVPFGTLIPRWVPAAGASNACPTAGGSVPKCQAAKFVPGNVLGIQFSMYTDAGFPKPSGSTQGTFDLWIDDVQFVKGDMGLPTKTGFPLTGAGSVGSCTKPTGADGKYLVTAYNLWKQNFAPDGQKVIRPENGNDTVSEGIAYGMLIAVNMNDQTLFDGLYGYWKGHKAAGSSTAGLMTWCIPAGSGSCSASGGSATDADEDTAFALLQAGKVWGGSYKADAMALISDIWAKDIDKTSHLPTGGSNYATTSGSVTNASYFAPAYYRAFKTAGDTNDWDSVVTAVYGVIGGSLAGSNGLFPAWCTSNCTGVGSNGGANDGIYQYDSHRIPMRIGLDYCWNAEARARTYVNKTTAFFGGNANAGLNGVGRIFDLYQLNGNSASGAGPNSASIIGTAAVGAMASSSGTQPFLDDAYQAVFDMVNRATLAPVDSAGKTPYSYYNATVGMLSLLMMTGNFSH